MDLIPKEKVEEIAEIYEKRSCYFMDTYNWHKLDSILKEKLKEIGIDKVEY